MVETAQQFAQNELDKYHMHINPDFFHEISLIVKPDLQVEGFQNLSEFDDAYEISVSEARGTITGVNIRSVLLGVYRYLYLIGCVFYAPGAGGEIIPALPREACSAVCSDKADYRHRGICIEGAVSLENILNMVDWAPKIGFNSYFIQFDNSEFFFQRWYWHEENPLVAPEEFSTEDANRYIELIEDAVKLRGLIYHKIGHGWTSNCLGYPFAACQKVADENISSDIRPMLAQLNDKRSFFNGIPLQTNLCYSNPKCRKLIEDHVVSYSVQNPRVDLLHFWLADNFNNVCECENCQKGTLTDFYIEMLNEIDRKLVDAGIKTKIVFLIYQELLWEPVREKLKNQDRFIIMFAPISRTYVKSYLETVGDYKDTPIPEYTLNEIKLPKDIHTNLAMFDCWKKHFSGDSFSFEYHLMWDIYRDLPGLQLSKVIHEDIVTLHSLGLDGLMSCQLNRSFFPTGFPMYVMGRTLFDSTCNFEDLKQEYFSKVYGEHAQMAYGYLEELSKWLCFSYIHGDDSDVPKEVLVQQLGQAKKYLKSIKQKLFDRYYYAMDTPTERAWKNLAISAELFELAADGFKKKEEEAKSYKIRLSADKFTQRCWERELDIQRDCDLHMLNSLIGGLITQWCT